MKLRTFLASISACAIAVSAMAISASALTYNGTIELNATDESAKMWQYDLTNLDGNGTLTQIVMECNAPFAATGWAGGGGAIGMNFGEEWYQVDFAPAENSADDFTITIDIPETYEGVAQDFSAGIIQIGWWWGAGDTLTIEKLDFVFDGEDVQTQAPAQTDAPAGTTTTAAGGTSTGDAGVALAVAGLAVAGAAAYVARKKD